MQNIQRIDSWSQFVKIVQEARSRTQVTGPAGNGVAAGAAKAGAHGRTFNPVQIHSPVVNDAPVQARQRSAGAKTKILGSFFDAYA
jgi:hypothetical protein